MKYIIFYLSLSLSTVLLVVGFSNVLYTQNRSENEFVFFSGNTVVYDNNTYKNVGDSRNIYRYDPKTGEQKVIMSSQHGINDVKLSPKGDLIAAIQYGVKQSYIGKQVDGKDVYYPVNNLIIVDVDGKAVFEIDDDVRTYDWSPDGNQIVFVVGNYREGGIGFRPRGTYIFHLSSNHKYKINEGSMSIKWAEFDNHIYTIGNGKKWSIVYKYDPITKKEIETNYKGINFSLNGKYYYVPATEASGFRLFKRETNKDITEFVKEMLKPSDREIDIEGNWYPGEIIWLSNTELIFSKENNNRIYSINERKVVKEFIGKIIPIKSDKFAVLYNGKIKIERYNNK